MNKRIYHCLLNQRNRFKLATGNPNPNRIKPPNLWTIVRIHNLKNHNKFLRIRIQIRLKVRRIASPRIYTHTWIPCRVQSCPLGCHPWQYQRHWWQCRPHYRPRCKAPQWPRSRGKSQHLTLRPVKDIILVTEKKRPTWHQYKIPKSCLK